MPSPTYDGFIPPCGVYCGTCPSYNREHEPCPGAEVHCHQRRCKSIYVCCVERKGLNHCFECNVYPCARFRRFAQSWMKCGQFLSFNQTRLRVRLSDTDWLHEMAERYRRPGVPPEVGVGSSP